MTGSGKKMAEVQNNRNTGLDRHWQRHSIKAIKVAVGIARAAVAKLNRRLCHPSIGSRYASDPFTDQVGGSINKLLVRPSRLSIAMGLIKACLRIIHAGAYQTIDKTMHPKAIWKSLGALIVMFHIDSSL